MNSSKDLKPNNLLKDEVLPDTNANVSNDTSKGAIPKKPKSPPQKKSTKPQKLNNNLENMSTLNNEELPKLNGLTNGIYETNSYLEPSCSFENNCKCDPEEETYDSDDNDILSVSDDGCIYTYKADLPSSFFALYVPPEPEPIQERNETSSPEMDYLEMDFDPGNNGDSNSEADVETGDKVDDNVVSTEPTPSTSSSTIEEERDEGEVFNPEPSTSKIIENVRTKTCSNVERLVENFQKVAEPLADTTPWSCTLSQRTKSLNFRMSKRSVRGELLSPNENIPRIKGASIPTQTDPNQSQQESEKPEFESAMIWTKEDAHYIHQNGQLPSSANVILNVLTALRFPLPSLDKIMEFVETRPRKDESPLTEYLLSRSVAGTTHEDIINALQKISNGTIYSRFFHMFPERVVNLYTWLSFWIRNGAVPIATLNLQRCVGSIPDDWHHQMIYGVDSNGIHLMNPPECVEAGLLWSQLCSESVLLVRREDVLSRWNFKTDLPALMAIQDIRWRRINVVGQVANMIHESGRELRPGFTNTSHIRIPASYLSGITLVTTVNSPACKLLNQSQELPQLDLREGDYLTYSY